MGTRGGRFWELLAAAAGIVLMISLLLPWYFTNGQSYSGSGAFGWTDKLSVILGIFTIVLPIVTQRRASSGREQAFVAAVAALALLTLIVIAIRVADPPQLAHINTPVSLRGGAILGLIAVIVVFLSLVASMRTRMAHRGVHARA